MCSTNAQAHIRWSILYTYCLFKNWLIKLVWLTFLQVLIYSWSFRALCEPYLNLHIGGEKDLEKYEIDCFFYILCKQYIPVVSGESGIRYNVSCYSYCVLLWQMIGPTDMIHHIYVRLRGAMLIQAQPGLFIHASLRHQSQAADK